MPTQAQQRQVAKTRVRALRASLKIVDTRLEIMERRLDKLLDRKTLITVDSFNSYLENMRAFYAKVRLHELNTLAVMTTFIIE